MYKKVPTSGLLDTVWHWEKRKNVPNQKFYFLDVDGSVKIVFDKKNLYTNKDFEGGFSLEADISGLNGTRRIEVNPYSEVGVKRQPIGFESDPPYVISTKLLNMISELRIADSLYEQLKFDYVYLKSYGREVRNFELALYRDLERVKLDILNLKGTNIDTLKEDAIALQDRAFSSRYVYLDPGKRILFKDITDSKRLTSALNQLKNIFEAAINFKKNDYRDALKFALQYAIIKTKIILAYFNSFENAGLDAEKAFLSLINKDGVNYGELKSALDKQNETLLRLKINFSDPDENVIQILVDNSEMIIEAVRNLSELSKFGGGRLEEIIIEVAKSNNRNIQLIQKESYTAQSNIERKKGLIDILQDFRDSIAYYISLEAAKTIYKRLVYATIDLGKSGAKVGEVLNIYLTWVLDRKKDSLSPRLPIGKYYLRETGWKTEVSDMFSLVKRIREANVADPTKISPSNFKGSGGAVLMWTYRGEDRGLKIEQKVNSKDRTDTTYSVKQRRRFINFLQPSIGLNVSYLDFSIDKDVEIGTGIQFGLFRNKIFFGYGYNLHLISPKGQQPRYFYIGFSFAKLDDLFKGSGSIKSIAN